MRILDFARDSCKQFIWFFIFSLGVILIVMTSNTQAIIGGLFVGIGVNIKWAFMMLAQQEDFLKSFDMQGKSFQRMLDCFLQYINRSKASTTEEELENHGK